MEFQLIRSKRRTVALVVNRQGDLIVRAPNRAPLEVIERFIGLKQKWIERRLNEARQRQPAKKQFTHGEQFWFLGQERMLRFSGEYRSKLQYYDGEFVLSRFQSHKAKALFEEWYRRQAKELLEKRAGFYAEKMGLAYKKLTITSADTRRGSCSSQATINFSWRLVMAPLEIIDYVVVHELAHIVHHNHSRNFWLKVQQFYPEFRAAKLWLNRHGSSLGF